LNLKPHSVLVFGERHEREIGRKPNSKKITAMLARTNLKRPQKKNWCPTN
jgi:hypothetical protein